MRHSKSFLAGMMVVLIGLAFTPISAQAQESEQTAPISVEAPESTQAGPVSASSSQRSAVDIGNPSKNPDMKRQMIAAAFNKANPSAATRPASKTKTILVAVATASIIATSIALPIALGVHNQRVHHRRAVASQKLRAAYLTGLEQNAVARQYQTVDFLSHQPNLNTASQLALANAKSCLQQEQAVLYSYEYDGWADFPAYPIKFLNDLNVFKGIQIIHGTYF